MKAFRLKILCFLLGFFEAKAAYSSASCDKWFKQNKVFEKDSCDKACANLPLDFMTVDCQGECLSACKKMSSSDTIMKQLIDLYPGLTEGERNLASEHPIEALEAYRLSWEAERVCKRLYPTSDTNDESDACRHYMWAGLLWKADASLAPKFLHAHEGDPQQPPAEKEMDLANNSSGMEAAKGLAKGMKLTDKNLFDKFKEELSTGKLRVLKPKSGKRKKDSKK